MASKTLKKKASKISSKVPRTRKKVDRWDEMPNSVEERQEVYTEAKRKYPSPSKDPSFKNRWDRFIGDVYNQQNFSESILFQLEVLCDLYVELNALNEIIKEKGYTYVSHTSQGTSERIRHEVGARAKVLVEVRHLTASLGLTASKKSKIRADDEDGEWD